MTCIRAVHRIPEIRKSQGTEIKISGFPYCTNQEILEKFLELLFTEYGNPEIKKLFEEGLGNTFSTSTSLPFETYT